MALNGDFGSSWWRIGEYKRILRVSGHIVGNLLKAADAAFSFFCRNSA